MIISFYKPNPSNSGNAVGLRFESKKKKLYMEFVKQSGWNASAKTGSFQEGAKFTISLNENEIGALLNCIERGLEAKLYHSTDKGATSIDFENYPSNAQKKKDKEANKESKPKNGFTISVRPKSTNENENPQKFGFWFIESEARQLRSFLEFTLDKFWSAAYADDKARREEYFKQKEENGGVAPAKKKKVEKAEEVAETPQSDDNPFA